MFWVTVAGVIVVFAYTAVAYWQAKVASNQLTLAYPPKLLVTNVAISNKGKVGQPVSLVAGSEIEGVAYTVNTGSEVTTFTWIKCVTYWKAGPLPMYRPYDTPDPLVTSTKSCFPFEKIDGSKPSPITMDPGEFGEWKFETTVPIDYTDAMRLYVMGYIVHHDRLAVRHLTLFARMYDPAEHRFLAVEKNTDYEAFE